jgi:hypothetical protein
LSGGSRYSNGITPREADLYELKKKEKIEDTSKGMKPYNFEFTTDLSSESG